MGKYQDLLAEDRRLSILLLLDAAPGGSANEALLHAALPEFGHQPSMDVVRADLAWLMEAGLAETSDTHGLAVARITGRGLDVAAGRATHPGVKRRRP